MRARRPSAKRAPAGIRRKKRMSSEPSRERRASKRAAKSSSEGNLKNRHIQLIAIGGAIGTGLFSWVRARRSLCRGSVDPAGHT